MAASCDSYLSSLDSSTYRVSPTPIPYSKQSIKQIENKHSFSPPPPIPGLNIHMRTKGSNVMGNKNTLLMKDSQQFNSIGYNEQRKLNQNNYLYHNQSEIDNINKNLICENTNSDKHESMDINDNYHDVAECKHPINDVDDILHKQGLLDDVCTHKVYVQCYNNHKGYCDETNPSANDDKNFDYGSNDLLEIEGSFKLSETCQNIQQNMEAIKLEKRILLLKLRKQNIMLNLQKITAKLNIEIQKVNTDIKIQQLKLKYSKYE